MGLNFIFDCPDAFLVGCVLEYEQHQQSRDEGDRDHPNPWAHVSKRQEENIKRFSDNRVKNPHFGYCMFPGDPYDI